jgi:hypothetical protein
MKKLLFLLAAGLTALLLPLLPPATPAQTTLPDEQGVEVQLRGPVHEAFAQPDGSKPEPGEVVPKAPPHPIPEEPPPVRPEGDNVQWFNGYWAWDADRNEFMWISGAFRDVPPGRRFVSGYWQQTPDGWRWVPGFWAPAGQTEFPYVPTPPASLDIGPSLPPPGDDYVYSPGYWLYRETRFVWCPGFWRRCLPGMVWVPPCYRWTPAGCLFVAGYDDYPLGRRGLLFAPVCFNRPLWHTPGWRYRPYYALHCDGILDNFFVRPRFGHYYYGNYYGRPYLDRGFEPWFAYAQRGYDPLWNHYRLANRGNPGWQRGLTQVYEDRLAGRAPLPPVTLREQTLIAQKFNNAGGKAKGGRNPLQLVSPVNQFTDTGVALRTLQGPQVAEQVALAARQQEVASQRTRLERELTAAPKAGKGGAAAAGKGRALKLPPDSNVIAAKGTPRDLDVVRPALNPKAAKNSGNPGPKNGTKGTDPKVPAKGGKDPGSGKGTLDATKKSGKANPPPGGGKVQSPPKSPQVVPKIETPPKTPGKVESPKTPAKVDPPKTPVKVDPPKTPIKAGPPKTPTKVDPPKISSKVDPPKTPTKVDPPKTPVKVNPPKTPVKVEQPKAPVKVNPPKTPVKVEQPKAPPAPVRKVEPPKAPTSPPKAPQVAPRSVTPPKAPPPQPKAQPAPVRRADPPKAPPPQPKAPQVTPRSVQAPKAPPRVSSAPPKAPAAQPRSVSAPPRQPAVQSSGRAPARSSAPPPRSGGGGKGKR